LAAAERHASFHERSERRSVEGGSATY